MLEPTSPRACQFTDDVGALPYCREFVFTLLDLAKDQISGGESATAYVASDGDVSPGGAWPMGLR